LIFQQLADFFDTVSADPKIGANHIVVYLALVNEWQKRDCPPAIYVATYEMLQVTRIRSVDTYLKHIRELAAFGYIKYQPALNEHIKAEVRFKKL
jgi:hypothetical protein